ncbi:hypothetical protein BpHYR1_014156 [Brachionus plicatilis]|uniref:Uncharacterized protein n=1 Tax=Brachionus plicatilis TaxID=10195 RepID=A0A3M7Q991_BRAPC|nr:hypothetical protein BpHYR1_014156 [Brachionus plicatilis]
MEFNADLLIISYHIIDLFQIVFEIALLLKIFTIIKIKYSHTCLAFNASISFCPGVSKANK